MIMLSLKTISSLVDAAAERFPSRLALISPLQSTFERKTYLELCQITNALAGWLSNYGFERNNLLISDLPNIAENLMLQIACNRLGVGYGTAKSFEKMNDTFSKVKGAVSSTGTGFLAETALPLPYISGDFLVNLINNGGLDEFQDTRLDEGGEDSGHGFYNTASPYTNRQALEHGKDAAKELHITKEDVVCISITLCHPFGLGSAVCSAFETGAAIVLPAVGGILGCGVPTERAEATLKVLESEKCSLLFADTHTLESLPPAPPGLHLRGGACKVGSGATFLEETRSYGGVTLRAVGKANP
jgi:hypothetical protein